MSTNDFTRFRGRLEVRGQLELTTPLRIGAGGGQEMDLADISVVKDALGRPYIPGSSFKGVLRSYVETVLRTIDEKYACLCVTDQADPFCPTTASRRVPEGQETSDYDRLLNEVYDGDEDALYLDGTCRICQVFGSHGLASKVIIPDLALSDPWVAPYQIRHGVSIDRDTETAAQGRLYTSEAVPARTRFKCEIIVENGSPADQGLVLLGLRAFEREMVVLGGATSRGLGRVKLTVETCQEISDEPQALLDYLMGADPMAVDEESRLAKIQALRDELGV